MKTISGVILAIFLLNCCKDLGIQRGSLKVGNTRSLDVVEKNGNCEFGLEIFGVDEHSNPNRENIIFTIKVSSSLNEYKKKAYYFSVHGYDNEGKKTQVLLKSSTGEYTKEIFVLDKQNRNIWILGGAMQQVVVPMKINLQCEEGVITRN